MKILSKRWPLAAAQRRRPAQPVRRLPHRDRPPPRTGLQPALGRTARGLDGQGGKGRAEHATDRRGAGLQLAATRPDLITGIDPATGQPAPYGATGVDINCAVIGFTDKAPTANLADPVPNSQFPPR